MPELAFAEKHRGMSSCVANFELVRDGCEIVCSKRTHPCAEISVLCGGVRKIADLVDFQCGVDRCAVAQREPGAVRAADQRCGAIQIERVSVPWLERLVENREEFMLKKEAPRPSVRDETIAARTAPAALGCKARLEVRIVGTCQNDRFGMVVEARRIQSGS